MSSERRNKRLGLPPDAGPLAVLRVLMKSPLKDVSEKAKELYSELMQMQDTTKDNYPDPKGK